MKSLRIVSVASVATIGILLLSSCGNSEETVTEAQTAVKEEVVEEKEAEQEEEELLPYETSENFGEWLTKSIEILDGELADPRIEQSGNDEGFTYYLKANAIFDLQYEMEAWAEGKAIGQDMSNLQLQKSVLGHLQFVRTSHLGREGQAVESVELADQWETSPDVKKDMQKAFEYMKQLLHDLDIAINHDGEGKTYGVTHTLNGANASKVDRAWSGGGISSSDLEIEMFTHGENGESVYESLDSFVKDLSEKWAHDSEFRANQMDYTSEMELVESSLYEIAYFESEIEDKGMTDLFEDLRQIAFEMVKNDYDEGDTELHDELADKYEANLNLIIEEMESDE